MKIYLGSTYLGNLGPHKSGCPFPSLDFRCFNHYLFFILYFIYLFILAALGLHCCAWAFSSCGERGLLFVAVHQLLIAVASRCGAWALGRRALVVVARRL